MTFLTILGVTTEILRSFRSIIERKAGKEIPESSRLEFLEIFLANNFALSDAEDNSQVSAASRISSIRGITYLKYFNSQVSRNSQVSAEENRVFYITLHEVNSFLSLYVLIMSRTHFRLNLDSIVV